MAGSLIVAWIAAVAVGCGGSSDTASGFTQVLERPVGFGGRFVELRYGRDDKLHLAFQYTQESTDGALKPGIVYWKEP